VSTAPFARFAEDFDFICPIGDLRQSRKIYVDRFATKFPRWRIFLQALVIVPIIDLNRSIGDLHPDMCTEEIPWPVASFPSRVHLRDRLDPLFGVAATKSLCNPLTLAQFNTDQNLFTIRITRALKRDERMREGIRRVLACQLHAMPQFRR